MSVASETGPLFVTLARSVLTLGASVLVASGRRIAAPLVAWLVVALLLTVGLAFLTLSGYRAILASIGPVYAALIVGCLYLMAALVAALLALIRRR